MRIITTDGKVYDIPDFCSYCNLDTAGDHEANCPNANVDYYRQDCKIKLIDAKHKCHFEKVR